MQYSSIEKEIKEHGSFAACARGNSMRPMLVGGEDMIILEQPSTEPCKYDVILYPAENEKEYILHRIVSVKEDCYIARGDNNYFREAVPKDKVIAVLVAYTHRGKRRECASLRYRLYSRLWNFLYPIRFVLHHALSLPKRAVRKIIRLLRKK